MFVFTLQVREAIHGHPSVLLWFGILAALIWILWAIKTLISRRYQPWTEPHEISTAVVIPVVDEPVDLFDDVLERILNQSPTELVVIINGPRNPPLEAICERHRVDFVHTDTPGKRNAVRLGVEYVTADIVVLVDSDTLWAPDTLTELVKPFADERVGGVTTNQRVLDPRRCFLTKWADWMESSRVRYSMPAQSVLGHVGCLPGRTIAFRRPILVRAMPAFLTARFLGAFIEVSDDRTLTNLALKEGWSTVYQSTSKVFTDCPVTYRKMARQQLRWARGSQYNTMRMLPWMLAHTPLLAVFFLIDILLPFLLVGSLFAWGWHTVTHTGVNFLGVTLNRWEGWHGWLLAAVFIVAGATLSMWLRQYRHLRDTPADYPWMPAFVLFSSFFLMPLRLVGFCVAAKQAGWGTRDGGYEGERHWNLWAVIPFLLAIVIIGAECALVVATT